MQSSLFKCLTTRKYAGIKNTSANIQAIGLARQAAVKPNTGTK